MKIPITQPMHQQGVQRYQGCKQPREKERKRQQRPYHWYEALTTTTLKPQQRQHLDYK
jgi:hypothetical protein